jgi:hypothetical protein
MDPQENSIVTFLMVGCQRCGTTWTDAALRSHPQIYLPPRKQSYFFDRYYAKGIDWYMERFVGVEPEQIAVGEVATGYCLPEASALMAKQFPNVKLIMVMRNPVERAYSNFQSRQTESGWTSFEQAIETDPELLERGQYIDQIEGLLQFYDRSQMLLLLYDDLNKDDRMYLRSILEFIGVDPDVDTKMFGQRKNAAYFPKLRKLLHSVGLKSTVNLMSKTWVGDQLRKSRKNSGLAYKPMNDGTKEKLIEHFKPFNVKLSELLQRDLTHWSKR